MGNLIGGLREVHIGQTSLNQLNKPHLSKLTNFAPDVSVFNRGNDQLKFIKYNLNCAG